uniref:Uncharacterized protein n=1 Tax=Vespula pensylvanica TaxID=30213 RepID=A0A834PGV2_VESPE|nr:hypothetical protein H0235_002042 [Vespula pensylvanica]
MEFARKVEALDLAEVMPSRSRKGLEKPRFLRSAGSLVDGSHPSVIVIIVLTIVVTRGYSRIVDRTKSRNRVHAKAGRGERGDVEEEETEDEEQKKRNRSLSRKDGY